MYIATASLRFVGSLKVQVSFAKEPYKRDDILQKRLLILRSLLTVVTPYIYYVLLHVTVTRIDRYIYSSTHAQQKSNSVMCTPKNPVL